MHTISVAIQVGGHSVEHFSNPYVWSVVCHFKSDLVQARPYKSCRCEMFSCFVFSPLHYVELKVLRGFVVRHDKSDQASRGFVVCHDKSDLVQARPCKACSCEMFTCFVCAPLYYAELKATRWSQILKNSTNHILTPPKELSNHIFAARWWHLSPLH